MPIEMRTMIFSRDEIAEALALRADRGDDAIPQGRVIYCQVGTGPRFTVSVKLVPQGRAQIQTIELGAETVGAALIDFCLQRGIPLPRRGSRSLQALGEAIAMSLTINECRVPLPAFA